MSYVFGLSWGFGEEGEADLPSGGIGAKLVEILESLRPQGMV